MNAAQLRSVGSLSQLLDLKQKSQYGASITNCKTETFTNGSMWLSFQVELLGLPETNMLRVVDHQWWAFVIGPRGAVKCISYPSHFKQFKGKRAFNVEFT